MSLLDCSFVSLFVCFVWCWRVALVIALNVCIVKSTLVHVLLSGNIPRGDATSFETSVEGGRTVSVYRDREDPIVVVNPRSLL